MFVGVEWSVVSFGLVLVLGAILAFTVKARPVGLLLISLALMGGLTWQPTNEIDKWEYPLWFILFWLAALVTFGYFVLLAFKKGTARMWRLSTILAFLTLLIPLLVLVISFWTWIVTAATFVWEKLKSLGSSFVETNGTQEFWSANAVILLCILACLVALIVLVRLLFGALDKHKAKKRTTTT